MTVGFKEVGLHRAIKKGELKQKNTKSYPKKHSYQNGHESGKSLNVKDMKGVSFLQRASDENWLFVKKIQRLLIKFDRDFFCYGAVVCDCKHIETKF